MLYAGRTCPGIISLATATGPELLGGLLVAVIQVTSSASAAPDHLQFILQGGKIGRCKLRRLFIRIEQFAVDQMPPTNQGPTSFVSRRRALCLFWVPNCPVAPFCCLGRVSLESQPTKNIGCRFFFFPWTSTVHLRVRLLCDWLFQILTLDRLPCKLMGSLLCHSPP